MIVVSTFVRFFLQALHALTVVSNYLHRFYGVVSLSPGSCSCVGSLSLKAANRCSIEGCLFLPDEDGRPIRSGKRIYVGEVLKDGRALKLDPESRPHDGKLGC